MVWRAAVIGCGRMGHLFARQAPHLGVYAHAQAYAACPATQLVAVCDPDPDLARDCAQTWGAGAWFQDPRSLLAEAQPQIVSICSPDPTHYQLALAALETPGLRALFMEKPLALDLDQAARVVELARARGVVLAVNYLRRYCRGFQAARRSLAAGELGPVQAVSGFYTKGVAHNGSHWFDLVRFLVGEITWVRAWPGPDQDPDDPGLEVELGLAGGVTARLHACRAAAYSVFELDILGEAGRLRLVDAAMRWECWRVGESPWYQGYRVLRPGRPRSASLKNATLAAVRDLTACLRRGGEPLCSGREALAALAVAQAARESAAAGGQPRTPARF